MHKLSAKLLLALSLVAGVAPWAAADDESMKTVDGVAIYVGMLPAELIQGHRPGHAEAAMHEGRQGSGQREHLVVALFDARTGERITDAEVSASVAEPGMHGPQKRLEPMQIAGTVTYGNFFEVGRQDRVQVRLEVRRPKAGVIRAEFERDLESD